MSNIFGAASKLNTEDTKKVVGTLTSEGTTTFETVDDVIGAIEKLEDITPEVLHSLAEAAKNEVSCAVATSTSTPDKKNFYVANGRVYIPIDDTPISISDINMLLNLEVNTSNPITNLLLPHLLPTSSENGNDEINGHIVHHAIGTLASILNEIMSTSSSSSDSQYVAATFDSMQTGNENPLHLSWNEDSSSSSSSTRNLQVKVSVILDPLTEPTQRAAPLLLAIRDYLKLPLRLILAPRKTVQNDALLSSYYRFVADPTAVPDTNPPEASFQNLPTNHLLTLRMDVPELWDVQQAHAVQDADN